MAKQGKRTRRIRRTRPRNGAVEKPYPKDMRRGGGKDSNGESVHLPGVLSEEEGRRDEGVARGGATKTHLTLP